LKFGSTMRSKFHFTAAALNAAPSENLTSLRRVNVKDLPSGEILYPVAR